MSGANQGNLMTNAVIDAFDGTNLMVSAANQQYRIVVPSTTNIVKQVPATLNDIAPGKRIIAVGSPATSISVLNT